MRNRWSGSQENTNSLVEKIKKDSHRMELPEDLDELIEAIGDAHYVLMGEASHGTSQFYTWRARLSQRLISEKGFSFIAVEGDWPDCYRVNRYIKGYEDAGRSAHDVLFQFGRWPSWMWANWEVAALAEGLKKFNQQQSKKNRRKAGFYGLDVYSLFESMQAIVDYLQNKDPKLADLAKKAYRCFEPYAEDVQAYAWSTRMVPESCEDEVVHLLQQMHHERVTFDHDPEAGFNAEQNALVMVNGERYYRAMVRSDQNSWNVRDIHMADTLDRLMDFHGDGAKAIVWAHNTHVGDARFTDMSSDGMVNLGQLMRERHGDEAVFLLGFGTHHGTVIAGQEWDAPMEEMGVPDAVEGSWEAIFHRTGFDSFYRILKDLRQDNSMLEERGNRAIGVVYNPMYERFGNYVPTRLPLRYDTFAFLNETEALHPLHVQEEEKAPVPDTYPWGI